MLKVLTAIAAFLFLLPPREASAEMLERLAIGCRSLPIMDAVVDAFVGNKGPDRLTAMVRSKDCRWLDAGITYTLTQAEPSDLAQQIRLPKDGTVWWVLKRQLGIADGGSSEPARPTVGPFDSKTAFSMATMQAILSYAKQYCAGSVDPNAEAAVALVARQNPVMMEDMIAKVRAAVEQQALKVGVIEQCRNIVGAYGPRGSVNAGAWRPARR